MKALATTLLVLAMALSGCSDDGAEATEGPAPSQEEAVDVPVWSVGDYWTYEMKGQGSQPRVASLVVTREAGGDYIIEGNDADTAYFDAAFDISMMGPQRKSDLAGSQGADRVQFLRFPLEDGMEWNTDWDGVRRTVTAEATGPGQFHLMAHDPDGFMAVEYHFDAAKGWMTSWAFHDPSSPDDPFTMTLTDDGSGFTGTIQRYTIYEAQQFNTTEFAFSQGQFSIDEGITEFGIVGTMHCGQSGDILAGLRAPDDQGNAQPTPPVPAAMEPEWGMNYACPGGGDVQDVDVIAAKPGVWRYDAAVASQGGWLDVLIEPRTLESVAFP